MWNHHIHNEQRIISLLAVLLREQLGLQYWPGGYLAWDGDGVFLPVTLGFISFFTFFFGLLLSVFLTVFSPLNSPDSGSFLLLRVTGLSRWATASPEGSSCGKAPWEETSWRSPREGLTREWSSWEEPQGEGSSWWRVPRIGSEGDKDGTEHLSSPGMRWLWDSWLTDAADRESHTAWGHAAELGDTLSDADGWVFGEWGLVGNPVPLGSVGMIWPRPSRAWCVTLLTPKPQRQANDRHLPMFYSYVCSAFL